jgi:hypothetical protein
MPCYQAWHCPNLPLDKEKRGERSGAATHGSDQAIVGGWSALSSSPSSPDRHQAAGDRRARAAAWVVAAATTESVKVRRNKLNGGLFFRVRVFWSIHVLFQR